MSERQIKQLIPSQLVSDGAGVKIRRSLGLQQQLRLDPFLMLDCFGSDQAADYIAGFPPHPHRGFETVTYMLDGHMLHQDHLGNEGHLMSGGVQWMTAGSGIIHSEMPQQESGLMRGFQLWLNLPAAEKMKDPAYVDLKPAQLGHAVLPNGGSAVVIAGELKVAGQTQSTKGPIQGLSTEPQYFDISLAPGAELRLELPEAHNALVYPFEGEVQVVSEVATSLVKNHHAAVLTQGKELVLQSKMPVRLLVLAAKAINEPVVQYGPFVMNTAAEIDQAIRDYQAGKLTKGAAGTLQVSAV